MKPLPGKLFSSGQFPFPERPLSHRIMTVSWLLALLLLVSGGARAHAGFSSIYVFGDSVSTTTNNVNPALAHLYYGHSFCNGRVWIERLAERQGVPYQASKNWSYFGHYSTDLLVSINGFSAADAATALFVVWVNDADFVYAMGNIDPPYRTNTNLGAWTTLLNQSLTNHMLAIQRLYAKGARTFVMPNAVDVSKVPGYIDMPMADARFVRERVISFNAGFAGVISNATASLPNIAIYLPDFFGLHDAIYTNSANYGLIKPGIDALSDPALSNKSLNGPGASYVFWDYLTPSAKSQAYMAEMTQQIVSPVKIDKLSAFGESNRLDIVNVPIGRDGFVQLSPDIASWVPGPDIDSTNAVQSVFVPSVGPRQFYRLVFPFAWSWP